MPKLAPAEHFVETGWKLFSRGKLAQAFPIFHTPEFQVVSLLVERVDGCLAITYCSHTLLVCAER